MKAKKFDSDFDQGKDITGSLDLSKASKASCIAGLKSLFLVM